MPRAKPSVYGSLVFSRLTVRLDVQVPLHPLYQIFNSIPAQKEPIPTHHKISVDARLARYSHAIEDVGVKVVLILSCRSQENPGTAIISRSLAAFVRGGGRGGSHALGRFTR